MVRIRGVRFVDGVVEYRDLRSADDDAHRVPYRGVIGPTMLVLAVLLDVERERLAALRVAQQSTSGGDPVDDKQPERQRESGAG